MRENKTLREKMRFGEIVRMMQPIRSIPALLIAALTLSSSALALDPHFSLTQYNHRIWFTQQGFTQGTVQRIFQGPQGYLWLGTQRGLVRFDGVKFTPAESIFPTLPANLWIRAGLEDKTGGIWIGTSDAGVFYLKDHTAVQYATQSGLPSDGVSCLAPSRDGGVWVCTANGMARIRDGKVESFGKDIPNAPPAPFSACENNDGSVWIGGGNPSLSLYRNGSFTPWPLKTVPAGFGVVGMTCSDGVMWAGSSVGLLRMEGTNERLFTTRDGLPDDVVYSAGPGSDGTLWIGTKSGFARYRNGEFSSFGTQEGLTQSSVFSVFEDREGSLWVGTKHGLNQFLDSRATPYTTNEGLPSNNVGPVIEDARGEVWVGTLDAGLAHLVGKRFTSITTRDGLASNLVHTLENDLNGDLWVGTEGGLNRLRAGKVEARFSTAQGLPSNSVRTLYHTLAGAMWVGTSAGPALFSQGRFVVPAGAPSETVLALGEDAQGHPLFSTDRGVFIVKDGKASAFEPSGIGLRSVDVFYLDPDGLLWLGTDGFGLVLVDGQEVTRYGTREGLFDQVIYGIIRDAADRLWMSCSKGVFSIPRTELRQLAIGDARRVTSTPFIPTDGQRVIEGREAVDPGAWTMGDGRLWFSTIRGLIVLDTTRRQTIPPPPVAIEDPLVNGEMKEASTIASLPPGEKNLAFHYTGLSFLAPAAITFRYKLDGYDKDWIEAGDRREAFYTNLPPRKYRFQVIACAPGGQCNQQGSSVEFSLAPYYYQRAWFYPLLVLLAAAAAWAVYQLRIRQVRNKYDLIVNERSRIARELHDTLIQGFSGITMTLQAFGSRLNKPEDKEALEDIIQDAAACLTETRRSVAGLRSGGASEESGLAEAIADAARQITETKDIQLTLNIEKMPPRLPAEVEFNLLRIAAEALSNSVKHSGANNIEVALDSEHGSVHLKVKDDGSGFVRKENGYTSEGHYGLVGMKERAAQIGAKLSVQSTLGRGTTVSVDLPMDSLREDKGVEALP
jgi:signal transduction histidine kinase/ligand-binding sensor domain-containing protein